MYISVDLLAKMLCVKNISPLIYFHNKGLKILALNTELATVYQGRNVVKIEDAIRYIHSDVERLQMITSYIPVNLFEKTIQDELLCRCDL